VAWEMDPGSGSRARQENGYSDQRTEEDDRLLDHHNEEVLAAMRFSMTPPGTAWTASDPEAPSDNAPG